MGFWNRIKFISKAQANKALNSLEDPIAMSEEAIRQMEEKVGRAREAQASVQALYIEDKSKADKKKNEADIWNKKAVDLNSRITSGATTAEEAEPLILVALDNHDKCLVDATKFQTAADSVKTKVDEMNIQIVDLESDIKTAKENLATLKARKLTADAMLDVNKELSNVGGVNSAHEVLERMEEKVAKTENLANAYQDLSKMNKSSEAKIDEMLSKPSASDSASRLAKFREGLN